MKPIPDAAVVTVRNGVRVAVWKTRAGKPVVAPITPDGRRCRVYSPTWWIDYRDHRGKRCKVPGSKIKAAAEHKMAQIVTDVERQRGGMAPLAARIAADDLRARADEFRDHLRSLGRSEKHFGDTHSQIYRAARDCRWTTTADVTLASWVRWVGKQREAGAAAETINHYLRSLRGLFRWMIRSGHLHADPLVAAEPLNADADRRVFRRALTSAEFRRLIDTTRASGKRRQHLDGPARAALYLFAGRTGFRAGVLAMLTKADVRLDDPTPNVPTTAKRQKNRKALTIPLSDVFVAELRAWIDARPDGLLWPGKWLRNQAAAKILRKDLTAAGIPLTTADGTFDFQALRGQCATDLALAGVPLHVTQQFLGHSTPALTAKHYLRAGLADLAAAAGKVG